MDRYLNPKHVIQRALALASIPLTCFLTSQIFTKSFPCSKLLSRNLAKTLLVLTPGILFPCGDRATSCAQEKLRAGKGVWKDLSCEKTSVGDGGEGERALDDVFGI